MAVITVSAFGSKHLRYASGIAELVKGQCPLLKILQVSPMCQVAH